MAMGLAKAFAAAALCAAAVTLVAGCAAPRSRDWREAAKAGDYRAAYADLYASWRDGTADVKAETLRHAWRSPEIMAIARADLAEILRQAAASHAGDLASFERAVTKGPLHERVAFAKLLDRTIDVEREIAAAHAKWSGVAQAAPPPPTPPKPVAPPKPEAPAKAIEPPVALAPAAPATPSAAPVPPAPVAPPTPVAKAAPASPPPPRPAPPAQVAEAKARAVWRCEGKTDCDKAWAAAESFVGANADMRIRSVTATAIETYPPIVLGEVGLSVAKVPAGGDAFEMRLTVNCRAGMIRHTCPASEVRIYGAFPDYLRAAVGR
ncbi:MAG: hypothetical protein KJ007_01300 [Burkholderiales bacterium]|nr:hypothetical protein [Burkholderiales bacterium]